MEEVQGNVTGEMTLISRNLRTESKLHLLRMRRTVCQRVSLSTRVRSCFARGRSETRTLSSTAYASNRRPNRVSRSSFVGFVYCLLCSPSIILMCSGWRMSSSQAMVMATRCCMSLFTTTRQSRSTSRAISLIRGAASSGPPTTALRLSSPKIPTLPYLPARYFMCGKATIASRHGGVTSTSTAMTRFGTCWFTASSMTLGTRLASSWMP